ncbi:MAG: hypothetical protein WC810_14345 [Janthinobacterium sp.]|jgi:hypothetical protein
MDTAFLTKIKNTLNNLWGGFSDLTGGTVYDITHPKKPLEVQAAEPQVTPPQPEPTQEPSLPPPEPTAAPGTADAMAFLQSQIPQGQTPQEYFPPLQNQEFMDQISEADKKKQGLSNLLLLQAFFESTLGRAGNGNNVFGAMPQGEGGQPASFDSPVDSLNYQMSPNVLGGGANPNMNVLGSTAPLTPSSVTSLYDSYNPNSAYLQTLLQALFPERQG